MVQLKSTDRELRFVSVNGGPDQHVRTDREERSAMRAFVMRDYLRQRNDPSWRFSPARVQDSMSSHISRFRTSKSLPTSRPKPRRRATGRHRRPDQKLKSPRPIVPLPVVGDRSHSNSESPASSRLHDLDALDPFQTFSVDFTDPESGRLLQYYHTAFWANSYACNPDKTWISVALLDPAIIHATLSLVAIHRRDCFAYDLSGVYFKHRGEAMKIVARRLDDMQASLSDATIGAVALLSSSDNHFDWPSAAPTSHSEALGQLIAMRGGMENLDSNQQIQRVAGWADLLQSAVHGTKLRVKLPRKVNEASIPATLLKTTETARGASGIPLGVLLQDFPQSIAHILRQLRILSELKNQLLAERKDAPRATFSDLLWKLEYHILDRPENTRDEMGTRDAKDSFAHTLMAAATGTAALIFSYLKLRDLAAPIVFDRLSSRLRNDLAAMKTPLRHSKRYTESTSENERLSWLSSQLKDEEAAVLLWCLYLGWHASRQEADNRLWFTKQIAQICWLYGILSLESIQTSIQSVIPQAEGLVGNAAEFWDQVEDAMWSEMTSI